MLQSYEFVTLLVYAYITSSKKLPLTTILNGRFSKVCVQKALELCLIQNT